MADDEFRLQLVGRIARDSSLLTRLRSRIADLEAEEERIRQRLASAQGLYRAEFGEDAPPPDAGAADSTALTVTKPGPLTGLTWEAAITRVIGEAGGPLHVKEIWRRITAGGFSSSARDPKRTIVAVCLRARLLRVAPNTYALPPREVEDGPDAEEVVEV